MALLYSFRNASICLPTLPWLSLLVTIHGLMSPSLFSFRAALGLSIGLLATLPLKMLLLAAPGGTKVEKKGH